MNWEAMALLAFGLCPGSALIGVLAGVALLRMLGTRWPWEQGGSPRSEMPLARPMRPRPGDMFTLHRVPADKTGMRVSEFLRYGWHLVYQDKVDSTGLYDLRFVWLGGEQ